MEPPQPTFSFLTLIHHLVKQSHDELKKCVMEIKKGMDNSNDQFEREASMRKQILYQHFQETRERFIRLLVLLRWSKKSKKTLDKFNQVSSAMDLKVNSFDMASFTLFHAAKILSRLREPVFDLPTSIDVLTTGTYPRLPYIIQQSRGDLQSSEDFTSQDKERAVTKLTDVIRMKLLQCTIPQNMFVNKLENGQVNLIAENEFSIIMTLNHKREEMETASDDLKYYWQIIYLDLLVNEEGITVSPIDDSNVQKLISVIQKRLYFLDETDTLVPCMVDIYNIIHLVTIRIAMDIITKQAKTLKWPNDIVTCETFNENTDQDFSLSLKYWHKAPPMVSFIEKVMDGIEDDEKNFLLKDKGSRNEIRIFVDKSKQVVFDMQPKLKANYTPALTLSKINLGKIISDCIFHHSIERLESIRTFLSRERIFPDIHLVSDAESNQTHLAITVFEEYVLILGIDWKTGLFHLHLSVDGEILDVDFTELLPKLNNIDVRKNKFSDQLLSVLETARKRTVIYAYKSAGSLLDLDVHSTLFEGDAGLIDENVYFSFPNVSTAFIQIRVTPFSYERMKPLVSSRVVIEKSPKIIDIPIPSSLFLDIYQPTPEEEIDSYEPTQKRMKRMKSISALQKTLVAFRHLKQIIAASKHKVLFGTMLRQVQISNRFSYDLTDQEYEMIILPNDNSTFTFLDLECITLSIDVSTFEWIATVYERRPLPVIIPPNSKQHYVNDRLTFKYTTMRNCQNLFEEFYQDLLSIDRMYPLALQVINPSPQFSVLLSQACTVEMVSHTKIRIDYGNCGYKLIIKNVDRRYRVILYPTNRFEADLEEYFNKHSRNDTYGEAMCKIVQILLKSIVPLNKLKQFLSDRHPTSWYLVPRSMYNFKVVHKGRTTREFLVTCRPSGHVEFKGTGDEQGFKVLSRPFGEEIDNAVLSLKRCCSSSSLIENMSAALQIALNAENINQVDTSLSFSSSTYEYGFDFQNYELKLTKIVPRKGNILTQDEEEFLKEAFSKHYLNSALDTGVALSTNFFSHSFLLILFFTNPLFKHVIQTWVLLRDKIDLVFFNPYPVRNIQRRTYDDSFGLAEIKLPTSLSALLTHFNSGKIFEKTFTSASILVRVYIGDDFIDLPIQYGTNMDLKFGDQKTNQIASSESTMEIIRAAQQQEVPEEGSDNALLKLLTYITTNCTIPQLLDLK